MHEHLPHIVAAAQHVQATAKYIPMTAKDKTTAEQGGIFAGAVAGVLALFGFVRSRGKAPVTSR